MIQIGAGKTIKRLDEMLESAMDGTFKESRFDETELSRLESRWKQYFTSAKKERERIKKERENMRALVSDIAHQTRTPLSNILLYAGLLAEEAKGDEEQKLARQVLAQTEKLEFLIQSLVRMSRLESDMLEVVPKSQSLTPLLEEAYVSFQAKAAEKGISLETEEEPEIFCAYDRKWTGEALGNVLDNAIKYSPCGSHVKIRVRAFEFYACIEVEDEGKGIREEEKAQIFTRFYRGRAVQQEEGIGVGLYLAREILTREDGYIKVRSKEGKGSIFGLYLPRRNRFS